MKSYNNSLSWIQVWFHDILHNTEFTHEFIIMNSYMISLLWIQQHEFIYEFIHVNSDMWFHDILRDHEFISEFILWIHIRFHNHEFICSISWPMNSYMNSCIWKISWNHTWIHVYQGSRWVSLLIQGYPGISHMSGYPGISLYKSGYGRASLFRMSLRLTWTFKIYNILYSSSSWCESEVKLKIWLTNW